MANTIPEGLRSADIGHFAIRAAQIEKVKPVVAYWCESEYSPQRRNRRLELTESLMM